MEVIRLKKKAKNDFRMREINVAAYARVSTIFEAQQTSYESQIDYYTNLIKRNANWNFVKVYADYGKSGKSLKNRDEFINMLNDAMDGKIDFILTKSVSRFARNTEDFLRIIRDLKEKNIGVYFEEENINTLNIESEMLLAILSSVAQAESENISAHVALAKKMSRKRGKIGNNLAAFGYKIGKNNNFIINEKEAKIIREIFQMRLNGDSIYKIVKEMSLKYKKYKFNSTNVRNFLRDQLYIGNVELGRTSMDKDVQIIKNHHEPIIDVETFNKVNEMKNHKVKKVHDNSNRINKLRCGHCGWGLSIHCRCGIVYYECVKCKTNKMFYGSKTNESTTLRCEIIENAFMQALKRILNIDTSFNDLKLQEKKLLNKRKGYYLEKGKILDSYMEHKINENNFLEFNNELEEKISLNNNMIDEIKNKIEITKYKEKVKNEIMENFKKDKSYFEKFDKDIYEKIIKVAYIGGIDCNNRKNAYIISFFYKHRNKYIELETNKNLSIDKEGCIPLLDFNCKCKFYSKKVRDVNGKKEITINVKKSIRVIFYVRKD